jgi:O-antigen/teichoic acid export membrane protein
MLGLVTIIYVVILLLIPPALGVQLFGDSWEGAAAVLLPMGLSSLASSLANGPAGVLYGMGQAQRTFRINLAKAPVLLCFVLVGAWLWGAVGAAWGLALTEALVLPLWLVTFRKALAAADRSQPSVAPSG